MLTGRSSCTPSRQLKEKKNHHCTPRVLVRASSHVLYLLSIVESIEPKQVYGVKLDFVSERTIKDHHHQESEDMADAQIDDSMVVPTETRAMTEAVGKGLPSAPVSWFGQGDST